MLQNQNVQFIDKYLKSQITNYLKNINEFNMEIDLGSISDSEHVFNTKIDKSIYDSILNNFQNHSLNDESFIFIELSRPDELTIPKFVNEVPLAAAIMSFIEM